MKRDIFEEVKEIKICIVIKSYLIVQHLLVFQISEIRFLCYNLLKNVSLLYLTMFISAQIHVNFVHYYYYYYY